MAKKIKVLWLCNVVFSATKPMGTGTWLHSMVNDLVNTGEVELHNITQAKVDNLIREDYNSICQWIVPSDPLRNNGLPSSKTIQIIQKIVEDINPDIIHIWGTESYWGLLTARGYLKGNVILEIQGLKFAIEKYFFAGLSFSDVIKCIGIKEIIKPSVSLIGQKHSFRKWGKFEIEMLRNHKFIGTQSTWVRTHVRYINPTAQIIKTAITLRSEFAKADKWKIDDCVPHQVFTSTSGIVSYKGLHVLIEAIARLKNRYPQIKLSIAGQVSSGIRQDGYSKWLIRKIKNLGINRNISWLGPLDADDIIKEIQKANVVVVPSFIESYCLALDEALTLGVPTVASFAGAMPELAVHEESTLFYSPGDIVMCANSIERLFIQNEAEVHFDENQSSYVNTTNIKFLSINAINASEKRHRKITNHNCTLEIYRQMSTNTQC